MTERYKAYPEYKDSGVGCLGEVPAKWSVAALRHALAGIKNGSTATQLDEGIGTVQISRIETISTGEINHDKVGFVEFTDALHHYRLNVGDILFSHINSLPMVGNIAQYCSKIPLYHGMNLLRLQPSAKVESRYLYWWLKSAFARQSVESLAKPAINQASIAIDQIKSIPCLYPMLDEQCTIANFLDHETAKIDALIEKQQQLISLLQEKRQAVISHAVTKGLNPDVPMKDSGVEWLGPVPEHWGVTRAKFVSNIFVPQRNKPELNEESGIPWATMEDMKKPYIEGTKNYVETASAKIAGSKTLKSGSVIASCVGNFGIASINCMDVIINQQLQAFIPVSVKAEYLRETVAVSKNYFELIGTAATLVYVNQQGFENLPVLLPPKIEQDEICEHIEIKSLIFNELITKCERTIELMKERRTALISAAVTGKIDVRNWQASSQSSTTSTEEQAL